MPNEQKIRKSFTLTQLDLPNRQTLNCNESNKENNHLDPHSTLERSKSDRKVKNSDNGKYKELRQGQTVAHDRAVRRKLTVSNECPCFKLLLRMLNDSSSFLFRDGAMECEPLRVACSQP